jgi:hypothetical protein
MQNEALGVPMRQDIFAARQVNIVFERRICGNVPSHHGVWYGNAQMVGSRLPGESAGRQEQESALLERKLARPQ